MLGLPGFELGQDCEDSRVQLGVLTPNDSCKPKLQVKNVVASL